MAKACDHGLSVVSVLNIDSILSILGGMYVYMTYSRLRRKSACSLWFLQELPFKQTFSIFLAPFLGRTLYEYDKCM